jgi:hypothetical protein
VHIYNRCLDFELTSLVCFGYNAIWIKSPDQKVGATDMTRASLGRELFKDGCANALIYKLHRKKSLKSDDKYNMDSAFTEDSSTSLQLLVIWGSDSWPKLPVRALLIKHSNTITWNEDTLERLYSMYLALLKHDRIEYTWLLDDATVLMTTSKWKPGRVFVITISEGAKKDDTMEPLWVSLNM